MTLLNQFSRRQVLAGAGAAAATLALGGGMARAQALKPFTYITPFDYLIGYAPDYGAVTGGHFAAQGIECTIIPGRGSAMAVQQTLSGNAQFFRASAIDIVQAVGNQGAPLTAIATVAQESPFWVISRANKPVHKPLDMLGKVIGVVSRGGGTENLLDMMLNNEGIKADTIRREVVGNGPGAIALVDQGRIDAFIVSVGSLVRLREAGEKIVFWNTDEHAKAPGQIYAATNELIAKDPDLCVRYLRAIKASILETMKSDRAKLVAQWTSKWEVVGGKDQVSMVKELAAEEKTWFTEGPDNLLRNMPDRWESITTGMVKAGLAKPMDATKLYTNAIFDKI